MTDGLDAVESGAVHRARLADLSHVEDRLKRLEVVMIGEPKGNEFFDLRKTGDALGVPVHLWRTQPAVPDVAPWPVYALEVWHGDNTHDLANFEFPDQMTLITGTTNRGLDPEWRGVIDGSIYIPQGPLSQTYLSVPAAGAMVVWEWHKQRATAGRRNHVG